MKSFELAVIRIFLHFDQLYKVTVEMAGGREGWSGHANKGMHSPKALTVSASSK